MNTLYHAKSSVKKWGGVVEDYFPIHDFIDGTKAAMPDVRHRALLHNSFGIFVIERVFGHYITNSDGKDVPVREIAERHIIEDLGFIPTPQDWLKCISLKAVPWAGGHANAIDKRGTRVNPGILEKIRLTKKPS